MISTLTITGAALLTVFVVGMLILFISMAVADNGYVGKHRSVPDKKRKKSRKRSRAPSGPRSYHRTLGGGGTGTLDRRPAARALTAAQRAERVPVRQAHARA